MARPGGSDYRLLRRALVASLGLHLLLALFLPPWIAPQSQGLQPVEAVSFARVTHVEIQKPSAAALPAAMPDTPKRAPRVTFRRLKAELSANTRKPRAVPTTMTAPQGKSAAAPRRVAAQREAPIYARVADTSTPPSAVTSVAAQTPQPQASIRQRPAAGNGAADRGGVLPFGASQDPVLDPSVRSELAQRFNVHVTLLVTVDEEGHTKSVVFQPPIDSGIERQIESVLAQANWDAAVCGGGVSCEGVATIKL